MLIYNSYIENKCSMISVQVSIDITDSKAELNA